MGVAGADRNVHVPWRSLELAYAWKVDNARFSERYAVRVGTVKRDQARAAALSYPTELRGGPVMTREAAGAICTEGGEPLDDDVHEQLLLHGCGWKVQAHLAPSCLASAPVHHPPTTHDPQPRSTTRSPPPPSPGFGWDPGEWNAEVLCWT